MFEKLTLFLTINTILCYQLALCAQLSYRQIDLSADEIDPNVSPLNNRPTKPIDNNNIIESVVVTTDINQSSLFTTIPPSLEDIPNNTNLASNKPTSTSTTTTSRPPPIIVVPLQPNVDDQKPIDKFCKCTEILCNCCRDFSLPLIPVRGPGCATIKYLGNEKMSVQIKYGDIVLASRTINGKKSTPVCVGLPGGYNRFCARFYGLSKEKSGFKSCMSLELRAEDDVEAQLRVSCFKFGRKGFSVTEAEPIPQNEIVKDDDDDDDDDGFFGLGGGDDDEDDTADEPDDDDDDDDDDEPAGSAATDDADYDFRFIEEIFDSDDDKNEKFTSVTERATISPLLLLSNNKPQTKENSINNANSNSNDDVNNENDENVTTPKKGLKKNKKKKKHDEDSYDMADIIYGILNLF